MSYGAGCRRVTLPRVHQASSRVAGSVRAVALAWLATTASTLAHIVSGGEVPTTAVTASMVCGLTLLCAPLVTGTLTVRRAVLLMGGLQLIVHTASSWVSGTRGAWGPTASPLSTSMLGGRAPEMGASSAAHPASHVGHSSHLGSEALGAMGGMGPTSSLSMLGAHVLTAVLLGWALAASERSGRAASAMSAVVRRSAALRVVLWVQSALMSRTASAAGRPHTPHAPRGVFHWAAPAFIESLWAPKGGARRGPPATTLRCADRTWLRPAVTHPPVA